MYALSVFLGMLLCGSGHICSEVTICALSVVVSMLFAWSSLQFALLSVFHALRSGIETSQICIASQLQ
jgi:hypothetical protein